MTSDRLALFASLVALYVVLAADVAFIVLCHVWVPWRSNAWGRHVMLFSYAVAGLLLFGLAYRWFGDYPGRVWVVTAFYWALAGAVVQRVYLLIRQHMIGRRERAGRDLP